MKSPPISAFKTNQGKASSSHLYEITWGTCVTKLRLINIQKSLNVKILQNNWYCKFKMNQSKEYWSKTNLCCSRTSISVQQIQQRGGCRFLKIKFKKEYQENKQWLLILLCRFGPQGGHLSTPPPFYRPLVEMTPEKIQPKQLTMVFYQTGRLKIEQKG